jgi:8-oxo-dGTP pyrophosphatase MutT (NUDIX family)
MLHIALKEFPRTEIHQLAYFLLVRGGVARRVEHEKGVSFSKVPAVLFAAVPPKELCRAIRRGHMRGGKGEPLELFASRQRAASSVRGERVVLRIDGRAAAMAGVRFVRRDDGFEAAKVPLMFAACSRLPSSLEGLQLVDAAGGVVLHPSGDPRVLVLRKGKRDAARWVLPKGRRRSTESLAEAARREVLEETGLSGVELKRALRREVYFDEVSGRIVLKRVTFYLMECPARSKLSVRKTEGFTAGRWVSFDEALTMTDPSRAHGSLRRARRLLASVA